MLSRLIGMLEVRKIDVAKTFVAQAQKLAIPVLQQAMFGHHCRSSQILGLKLVPSPGSGLHRWPIAQACNHEIDAGAQRQVSQEQLNFDVDKTRSFLKPSCH